jgi:hypothetical protein
MLRLKPRKRFSFTAFPNTMEAFKKSTSEASAGVGELTWSLVYPMCPPSNVEPFLIWARESKQQVTINNTKSNFLVIKSI